MAASRRGRIQTQGCGHTAALQVLVKLLTYFTVLGGEPAASRLICARHALCHWATPQPQGGDFEPEGSSGQESFHQLTGLGSVL